MMFLDAKARPAATAKIIIGKNLAETARSCYQISNKIFAPSRFVIPDKVHAIARIRIGAIIALKPSGTHSANSWNVITSRSM